jgi:hypothetical protein
MKTFESWWEELTSKWNFSSNEEKKIICQASSSAWDECDLDRTRHYSHKIKNLETALQLKEQVHERKMAEVRKDLEWATDQYLEISCEYPDLYWKETKTAEEIRQRHNLDGVKNG